MTGYAAVYAGIAIAHAHGHKKSTAKPTESVPPARTCSCCGAPKNKGHACDYCRVPYGGHHQPFNLPEQVVSGEVHMYYNQMTKEYVIEDAFGVRSVTPEEYATLRI